jgi:transglutaminase-like putative cysteine protease
VFVACCRAAGIPARYVSGYVYTGTTGEVASHAWADAWLGEREGWLSLDVSHGEATGAAHCRLAVGRDYLDAAPVRGVRRGGGREELSVAVRLAPMGASGPAQGGGHQQQ